MPALQIETKPNFTDALALNLPASNINAKQAGRFRLPCGNMLRPAISISEVSALEADGRGKVVSRPRVMTADKAEALTEQGPQTCTRRPRWTASTVSFKKANLRSR